MDPLKKSEIVKILAFAVVVLWLYWLWTRRHLYKFALNYPGKLGLPLFGDILKMPTPKRVFSFFEEAAVENKTHSFCFWMGSRAFLLTTEPSLIQKILLSNELWDKAETIYTPLYQAFRGGIIASGVEEWKKNRKLINPSFNHNVLVSFFPVFHKAKLNFIDKLVSMADDGVAYKLFDEFQRMTISISVETTMGKVMKEGDKIDEDFITNFKYTIGAITPQILLSSVGLNGLTKFNRKFHKALGVTREFVYELIKDKLRRGEKTKYFSNDSSTDDTIGLKKEKNIFIDQAMDIYLKKLFTWNDLVAESNTIMAASFETTANGMFSALVFLAMHPEVQERLFDEIKLHFPDKDFVMEYDDFEHLPYLSMVINEVLRLSPSVPVFARQVAEDVKLDENLILPKGLQILISIYNLHRRKDIWGEDADKFDPDRFSAENMADMHPFAYIPFSKGARNCIGWRYALFVLRIVLAGIVRNFRFETDMKYEDIHFYENITIAYEVEPKLRIYRREN